MDKNLFLWIIDPIGECSNRCNHQNTDNNLYYHMLRLLSS